MTTMLGRRVGQARAVAAAMLRAAGAIAAQPAADDAGLAARGAYLARAADCLPCHTGNSAQPFAGGLAIHTPFGVIYSPNITSDPATGIGSWSFADFRNALHDGIRADGAYLYPAMPFDAYTEITEPDLAALWAYIRRLPPIAAPNLENQLSFPFDIRSGMLAWRELYFAPGYFHPTPGKNAAWNRGAYLVEGLGHCSDCHSPRNIMGAVKGKAAYTGTEIDGFYAPDIDAAALKKNWNPGDLAKFLSTGSAPQRSSVFGPMALVVHDSLAYLTQADLSDLVSYLFDAPPPADEPAPQRLSPLPRPTYLAAAHLYIDNCATCHRDHGRGIPGSVPPLAGNPAVTPAEPYNLLMAVLGGIPSSGAYMAMPSFAGRLTDKEIADVVDYVRSSWGNRAAPSATPKMVATWREIARVPEYGTQAAAGFGCPQVGGAPGVTGPNPQAVGDAAAAMKSGDRSIADLIAAYRKGAPDAGAQEVVDGLLAAYCPLVAARDEPTYQKYAALRRFGSAVEARALAPPASHPPQVDVVWAVPAGRSLVYHAPAPFAGRPLCPADDGRLVPQDLVAKAASLLGRPHVPVAGGAPGEFATKLAGLAGAAPPADLANALILAYCRVVTADSAVDPAQQRAWLLDFGTEVAETLQARAAAGSAN